MSGTGMKLVLATGGILAFGSAAYIANTVAIGSKAELPAATHESGATEANGVRMIDVTQMIDGSRRLSQFSTIAKQYDSKIGFDELVMGLPLLRRWLIGKAQGDCLEIAAGTGRNLKYYTKDVKSLVLVDQSDKMVEVCNGKASAMSKAWKSQRNVDGGHADNFRNQGEDATLTLSKGLLACKQMDVERLPFEDNQFDTVVDTFGLCSVEDPVATLKEMSRVCKPGGKILLLEHGRSHWQWLSNILDKGAFTHARDWGCWWNRDIQKIMRDSGVVLEQRKTFHLGTTHYAVARPPREK